MHNSVGLLQLWIVEIINKHKNNMNHLERPFVSTSLIIILILAYIDVRCIILAYINQKLF